MTAQEIHLIVAAEEVVRADRRARKAHERAKEALRWLAAIACGEHPPIPSLREAVD
jgi:hypothetical protein